MTKSSTTSARVLRGKLGGIRKAKSTIDFFFSDADDKKMAATGVAAAAMGMSGVAAGMVSMSLDETSAEVEKIDFKVDGVPVQGLFWAFPFEEGDDVDFGWSVVTNGDVCLSISDIGMSASKSRS